MPSFSLTRANRGLGQTFVNALLQASAAKIYAAARCTDLTLLIKNAGIYRNTAFLTADSADVARAELETNFFDPLMMSKTFAPILKANGGTIVNVLSVLSCSTSPLRSPTAHPSPPHGHSPMVCRLITPRPPIITCQSRVANMLTAHWMNQMANQHLCCFNISSGQWTTGPLRCSIVLQTNVSFTFLTMQAWGLQKALPQISLALRIV
ncbi:MAG: SDR family NAD(P)-dependent oxidoreductase [Gallionella sp.]|nr:SDR family NAD(P)-dependent oxidoreductase [Gallionella sp.]MDD4959066.1 SDR family NAD(P)-dependent oxidoreductase [Gallionella sp.]